jgi:hypothetical protein
MGDKGRIGGGREFGRRETGTGRKAGKEWEREQHEHACVRAYKCVYNYAHFYP